MALPILLAGQAASMVGHAGPGAPTLAVQGVEVVIKALQKMATHDGRLIQICLEKMGAVILKKAQYYVPKDTYALSQSGKVEVWGKGMAAKLAVEFDTHYALVVHEDTTANHASPTCAKYLERAVRESRGTCTNILKRTFEVTRTR